MACLQWNILLTWMIWGVPLFNLGYQAFQSHSLSALPSGRPAAFKPFTVMNYMRISIAMGVPQNGSVLWEIPI